MKGYENLKGINVFWPVYKNLEQEVLNLSKYIIFNDEQLKVYSLTIADLIIRASIDVEAISKELYYRLGGKKDIVDNDGNKRDLYFDTDCLEMLKNKWGIDKKKISIATPNFFFENKEHKYLTPLNKANKRGDSGCKWKRAYQALKHDRINSLKKANIENLIYVMGALYILNLYYRDEIMSLTETDIFDNRLGSEIFSVAYSKSSGLHPSLEMNEQSISFAQNDNLDESVYIVTYDLKSFKSIHSGYVKDYIDYVKKFSNHSEITNYLKEHPPLTPIDLNSVCLEVGGMKLLERIMNFRNMSMALASATYEAKLNKNEPILPEVVINDLSQQEIIDFFEAFSEFNKFEQQVKNGL